MATWCRASDVPPARAVTNAQTVQLENVMDVIALTEPEHDGETERRNLSVARPITTAEQR